MVTDYYNWNDTLARDADITMVIGARGIGKTYGIRLQFVKDYLKKGYRFVELVRYKNELPDFTPTYFQRIEENDEFPGYIFKTSVRHAYIAKKTENGDKPEWQIFGYFGSLSQAQSMKKWTFSNVRRIYLDEAVIDKRIDRWHGYLRNEYSALASIVDSVARENKKNKTNIKPSVILTGNACDLMNPYFIAAGIYEPPKEGYTWWRDKTMLVHYVQSKEYGNEKREDTVAGRMLKGTVDDSIANDNAFVRQTTDFVSNKSKNAKFYFGIVYQSQKFGVWIDKKEGYYYVTSKIPNNAEPIFALTTEDNRVNYIMGKRVEAALRGFVDMYYMGIVRFESPEMKGRFTDVLQLFGVR